MTLARSRIRITSEKAHAESSANDEQTKAIASILSFPQAQKLMVGIASQSEPRMGESLRSIVGRYEEATQTKTIKTNDNNRNNKKATY
jgi:hypothetical protein